MRPPIEPRVKKTTDATRAGPCARQMSHDIGSASKN